MPSFWEVRVPKKQLMGQKVPEGIRISAQIPDRRVHRRSRGTLQPTGTAPKLRIVHGKCPNFALRRPRTCLRVARRVEPSAAGDTSEKSDPRKGLARRPTTALSIFRPMIVFPYPKISLTLLASVVIGNGFVRTSMPGSIWPFPTAAFSA